MKIAINTRFLLKDRLEGVGWYTYEVVKRMVEDHPEHEFIFLFDRPYDEDFIFGKNVKPIVVFPPARHPLLWYLWFEWALPRALRKHQADVFLSPDNYLSLSSKVPTVMVTHDIAHLHFPDEIPPLVKRFYDYFVPRYLQHAKQIITVSEYTKQDILKQYPVDERKIEVAYNGCREYFRPLNEREKTAVRAQFSDGKAYFFYIGAIHPRKNVPRLIEAFDQFKKERSSDLKLLLGGRFRWQTGAVKSAWEAAEHQEDIVFLGYLSEENLAQLMGAALALTYVSLFEGFGVPLLEAMHCEIPVITSKRTSMPEVIGKAGLLVDPNATSEMTQAMHNIVENKGLRASLIQAAKQQKLRFRWDNTAKQIYERLIRTASGSL